jgi:hypothetical protein
MFTPKSLDAHLTTRVNRSVRIAFIRKAERYGKPAEVLRELVEAFVEDRLAIQPPVTHKENLYVTRIQN